MSVLPTKELLEYSKPRSKLAKMKTNSTLISGSDAVIRSILAEGVKTIFGYPGGAIMPIYNALYDYSDKLEHILVRHEQGAAHAAEGYARIKGDIGVCLATSGPGATNLITGLADAMIDSVPIICITGQVGSTLLGSDAFQETDVIGISMPVTKWNYQITCAKEIASVMAKAFYIAITGRPGPVLIDITKDAQFEEVDFQYKKCERLRSYFPYPIVKDEDIKSAAVLINSARKPMILAGQGIVISDAESQLQELAVKADIPVASTLLGLSAFPSRHPLYVGMLGMHGNYGPNVKTNECDLLIAIGMRFDDRITGDLNRYAKQAAIIHIEIDPSEINKNVEVDVGLNADVSQALKKLLPHINENNHSEWIGSFEPFFRKEREKIIEPKVNGKSDQIIMDEVVAKISEKTRGEAIVVTDVGQNQMVSARNYKFNKAKSWVTSGGLGTMGFGLPAAIGAKKAAPNRTVVAFIGDGGFQMTIQELGTMVQSDIVVKVVILNNKFLGMVRQWQDMFFDKRYSFTEISSPDFVKMGDAYGIQAERVSKRSELDKAINRLIDSEGSFLLEVNVAREDNVFPMIPSGESVSNIRLE